MTTRRRFSLRNETKSPIDGVWATATGKRIRIRGGEAIAIDAWRQAFVLEVEPGMVVLENLKPARPGVYAADDRIAEAPATFRLRRDGNLSVVVHRAGGPLRYDLMRRATDDENAFRAEIDQLCAAPTKFVRDDNAERRVAA